MSQQKGALASSDDNRGGAASALLPLILKGKPFSGDETDCVFVNTGGGRFADVSHAVGFNSPDDGRALMRSDWDQDGDLDFWLINRNGPTVRFLRNDAPTSNRSVMILLEGTKGNRDAVGARVEMTMTPGTNGSLVRTVRAGDGFLAQSTRWLHFGLGQECEPVLVTVRWPGGAEENFSEITAGERYRLVEGSGHAQRVINDRPDLAISDLPLGRRATTDTVAASSASRLPVPSIDFIGPGGERTLVTFAGQNATLVNLWASWCLPCLTEIRDFTKNENLLRRSNIDVLALSLDSIAGNDASDPKKAGEILEKMKFPFSFGLVTPETIHKLEMAHAMLFQQPVTLPVPTSFLVDRNGRIAAVYRGPVSVERLLADASRIGTDDDTTRDSSVPLNGRWASRLSPIRLVPFVYDLLTAGYVEEAYAYVTSNRELLSRDVSYLATLNRLAEALVANDDSLSAARVLDEVLNAQPDFPNLRVRIGLLYGKAQQPAVAAERFREAIARSDNAAAAHYYLSLQLEEQDQLDEALTHARAAAEAMPDYVQALEHLASLLDRLNHRDESVRQYRLILEADPANQSTLRGLAWILATHPDENVRDGVEAVRLAQLAVELSDRQNVDALRILAASRAETGDFQGAIAIIEEAIPIAGARGLTAVVNALDGHREEYIRGRPIRVQ